MAYIGRMEGCSLIHDDDRELSSSSTFLEFNESHDFSPTYAESKYDDIDCPENRHWIKPIQYNEQTERKNSIQPLQESKEEESKCTEHTPRRMEKRTRVQQKAKEIAPSAGPENLDISEEIAALNEKYPNVRGSLITIKNCIVKLEKMSEMYHEIDTPPHEALPTSPTRDGKIATASETEASSPKTNEDSIPSIIHNSTNANDGENKIIPDYIYELNPITGNFQQRRQGRQKKRKDKCRVDEEMKDRDMLLERIGLGLKVGLFLLQGLLAGFSVQTLHEISVKQSTSQFAIQYGKRAKGTFRFYFLSITLSLSGSISRNSIMARLLDGKKKANESHWRKYSVIKISVSIIGLMYFLALIITLLTTKLDSSLREDIGTSHLESNNDMESSISRWKSLSASRSVVCILGWCIACLELLERKRLRYHKKPASH